MAAPLLPARTREGTEEGEQPQLLIAACRKATMAQEAEMVAELAVWQCLNIRPRRERIGNDERS